MKRMLFNATHAEELRVAITDGQKLIDLDLESAVRSERKGNIYKGVITKVEPSLEACFVNYGAEKHGFLPFKEIYRGYFANYDANTTPIAEVKIEKAIKESQQVMVQVNKDERGSKGAALTTFISLAGRFLVLMPNNPKGGGISRRIAGPERDELRQVVAGLQVDPKHSLIARTEGIGRGTEELQWDLDFLARVWKTIETAADTVTAPMLIYQDSSLIVRSIRDHLSDSFAEIIVDDEAVYERASRFINQVMPNAIAKLKLYRDSVPLFSRYQIEAQIDAAFNREVSLPSGGAVTIDHTEALIAVDVNSARATKGGDIEETAFQTNLEAVEEVARQIKIRDIGGLIVIDLIDMNVSHNQRAVETRLKETLKADRARVQVGHISRFGLLEMSRQRLRASLSDVNYRVCPRCEGTGAIRNVVSASLHLLRLLEEEALKEKTDAIQVALPLDMATYLLNEKRHELHQLEARLTCRIIIIPNHTLVSPYFEIKRLRSGVFTELVETASYDWKIKLEKTEPDVLDTLKVAKPEKPSVTLDHINQTTPPRRKTAPRPATGGWRWLRRLLGRLDSNDTTHSPSLHPAPRRTRGPGRSQFGGRNRSRHPNANTNTSTTRTTRTTRGGNYNRSSEARGNFASPALGAPKRSPNPNYTSTGSRPTSPTTPGNSNRTPQTNAQKPRTGGRTQYRGR